MSPGVEDSPPTGAEDLISRARSHLKSRQYEQLLALIEPAEAARLPEDERRQMAEVFFQAGVDTAENGHDASLSTVFCERGLLMNPSHPGMLRRQIKNYMNPELQLVLGAEELAIQLVQIQPDDVRNQALRGWVALEQGDYEVAVEWLEKAVREREDQNVPNLPQSKMAQFNANIWKMLEAARGKQEELNSSLSMTRNLEKMFKKTQARVAKGAGAGSAAGKPKARPAPDEPEQPVIVLYETRWCKFCQKTRVLLRELQVDFVAKDIEHDSDARLEMVEFALRNGVSINGVPVIRIGDQLVRGYNPVRLKSLIQKTR